MDEAHNWKNGPTDGTNGYAGFRRAIACRTRRMLLLTATPFQLRPQEILELLRISDDLHPGTDTTASQARREALREHRENVVRPVLLNAAHAASRGFAKAWARPPPRIRSGELQALWDSRPLALAREQLRTLARERGAATSAELEPRIGHRSCASSSPRSASRPGGEPGGGRATNWQGGPDRQQDVP